MIMTMAGSLSSGFCGGGQFKERRPSFPLRPKMAHAVLSSRTLSATPLPVEDRRRRHLTLFLHPIQHIPCFRINPFHYSPLRPNP